MGETFGNDVSRIVGTHKKEDSKLKDKQFPLVIDDNLQMTVEISNIVSKACDSIDVSSSSTKKHMEAFQRKLDAFGPDELKEACTVDEVNLLDNVKGLIPCVGCRRGVEEFLHQNQDFDHSLFESMKFFKNGTVSVSSQFISSSKRLFHLFYVIRPMLYRTLDGVVNGKKNKRCSFHSLKMMKPNEHHPAEQKYSIPKAFGSSIIDIWDQMCQDCHVEITRLECNGIVDTMDYYLKKHRFCTECKSKVQRAYHMLIGDVDHQNEPGYCEAIFEGFEYCKSPEKKITEKSSKNKKDQSYVHVCCERSYIVHILTQADAEVTGGKKERHAKTIDIAQEEVCTCMSLYLYYRLHKVWHTKLTFEQTWLTLLLLSVEAVVQKFETSTEQKFGVGRMEAFCQELEHDEEMKNLKLEKKRLKRRNKQKKKREQKSDNKNILEVNETPEDDCENGDHDCSFSGNFKDPGFSYLLVKMLQDGMQCDCVNDDEDILPDLQPTPTEIRDFEENRAMIDAQRTKLRNKLKQNFNDYVVNSTKQVKDP